VWAYKKKTDEEFLLWYSKLRIDLVSLQRLGSLLWHEFNPWPGELPHATGEEKTKTKTKTNSTKTH